MTGNPTFRSDYHDRDRSAPHRFAMIGSVLVGLDVLRKLCPLTCIMASQGRTCSPEEKYKSYREEESGRKRLSADADPNGNVSRLSHIEVQ